MAEEWLIGLGWVEDGLGWGPTLPTHPDLRYATATPPKRGSTSGDEDRGDLWRLLMPYSRDKPPADGLLEHLEWLVLS